MTECSSETASTGKKKQTHALDIQRPTDDHDRVLVQISAVPLRLPVERDQLTQLRAPVHDARVRSEDEVQEPGDGVGDDEEDVDEHLGRSGHEGADPQPEPAADRLGDDLGEASKEPPKSVTLAC